MIGCSRFRPLLQRIATSTNGGDTLRNVSGFSRNLSCKHVSCREEVAELMCTAQIPYPNLLCKSSCARNMHCPYELGPSFVKSLKNRWPRNTSLPHLPLLHTHSQQLHHVALLAMQRLLRLFTRQRCSGKSFDMFICNQRCVSAFVLLNNATLQDRKEVSFNSRILRCRTLRLYALVAS